jgi:hypothetical protein
LNVRYLQRRKLLKVHDRIIYTQEKETVQSEDSCNMENGSVLNDTEGHILHTCSMAFFWHQICSNLINPRSQVA